jgi:hypothetical protein
MSEATQGKLITKRRPSPAKAFQARIVCHDESLNALRHMHELPHLTVGYLTDFPKRIKDGRPSPARRALSETMLKKGTQPGGFSIPEPLTVHNGVGALGGVECMTVANGRSIAGTSLAQNPPMISGGTAR